MALRLEDGGGSGQEMKVNTDGRGMVSSQESSRLSIVSRETQRSFSAVFEDASAAAGDYVGYIKNTSTTRNLIVELIRVSAVNAGTWKLVVATGTATGGNSVTAANLNRGSGITAEATITADAVGGFTAGTLIAMTRNPTGGNAEFPFHDALILPPETAIALEYDAGTTGAASATIRFYYELI